MPKFLMRDESETLVNGDRTLTYIGTMSEQSEKMLNELSDINEVDERLKKIVEWGFEKTEEQAVDQTEFMGQYIIEAKYTHKEYPVKFILRSRFTDRARGCFYYRLVLDNMNSLTYECGTD